MKGTLCLAALLALSLAPPRAHALDPAQLVQGLADIQRHADGATDGAMAGGVGAGLGYTNLDGQHYLSLDLGLDLDFGIVGLGIQAPLNILIHDYDAVEGGTTAEKAFRKQDWDEWSDFLKILRYIRVFHKGDTFYARIGSLDHTRIGHGTIMNDYFNNLRADHFSLGVAMDVNTRWFGLETIVSDVTQAPVVGGRLWLAPTTFFQEEEGLGDGFRIGLSYVVDTDAPLRLETETDGLGATTLVRDDAGRPNAVASEMMHIAGVDLEFEVFKNSFVSLMPYTDLNLVLTPVGDGAGGELDMPLGYHLGLLMGFTPMEGLGIHARLEYRYLTRGYMPGYFNTHYDIERLAVPGKDLTAYPDGGITRLATLSEQTQDAHGWYGELSLHVFDWFVVGGELQDYDGDDNGQLTLFASVPALDFLEVGALYTRRGFDGLGDAFALDEKSMLVAYAKGSYSLFAITAGFMRTWQMGDEGYESIDDFNVTVGIEYDFGF